MTPAPISEPNDNRLPIAYSYVRFSSAGQREGTSVDRQVTMGREWAEKNNYEYSNDTFEDLGVSGFTGANLEKDGGLGDFLKAVEIGSIKEGSVLLIEKFDRFSRMPRITAQRLFEDIVLAGVNIVTTHNGKLYTKEILDNEIGAALEIVLGFQFAHDFSKTLQDRVGKAWKINADKVKDGSRKRTTRVPSWIKVVGSSLETTTFEVIEDKAKVVRRVFAEFADGKASTRIAKEIREDGIPTLSGRGTWARTMVNAIVQEVTPYGTLLIGQGSNKERKIVDEMKDYYPRIIDQDTQRRVLMRLKSGNSGAGGSFKGSPKNKTRGRLVGVLRSNEGNKAHVKRNNRSIGYYDYITAKYIGTVMMIDSVLINHWDEVLQGLDVSTSPEIESTEAGVVAYIEEQLVEVTRKNSETPTPAYERIILGLKANLEEAREEVREMQSALRFDKAVPREIAMLDIADANVWVRRVIKEARVTKVGKGKAAKVRLELELKNGVRMGIGDESAEVFGFQEIERGYVGEA